MVVVDVQIVARTTDGAAGVQKLPHALDREAVVPRAMFQKVPLWIGGVGRLPGIGFARLALRRFRVRKDCLAPPLIPSPIQLFCALRVGGPPRSRLLRGTFLVRAAPLTRAGASLLRLAL